VKKASALIYALLVMGLIGIVAAGVSRVSLVSVRTSSAISNSTTAYFAAQSGIEHALLKYRYDRDYETAINGYVSGSPTYAPDNLVFRRYFLIKAGGMETWNPATPPNSPLIINNDQWQYIIDPYSQPTSNNVHSPGHFIAGTSYSESILYDLKMQYRNDYIGCDDFNDPGFPNVIGAHDLTVSGYQNCTKPNNTDYLSGAISSDLLKLDENEMSVGFNIEDGPTKDVYVYWKFNGATEGMSVPEAGMQIEIRGNDAGGKPQTATIYFSERGGTIPGMWPYGVGQFVYFSSNPIDLFNTTYGYGTKSWTNRKLYLRPWKTTGITTYFGIQPWIIGTPGNPGGKIGGPITQVESIGYYRGVKRKLWAEINRKTGELSGSFDFVVSGQNISN